MSVNPTNSPNDLGQIQKLISAGELPAALKQLECLPDDIRGSVDGLYMAAVCNRHMGRLAAAEEQLLRLVSIAPEFSRAHQELGHLRKGQGRPRDALTAYVRACAINPALEASWRSQLAILQASPGDETRQRQEQISAQLKFLHSLHPHILAATDMMHEGKLIKAENLCRRFLQQNPKNIEGMRLLAELGLRLGVLEDAEFLLESAAEFEPDNIRVRLDYVKILQKRQRFAHAHDESLRLLEIAP